MGIRTPYFVFDKELMVDRVTEFKSKLIGARIDYSVKTNCELPILRILRRAGVELEVVAGHEIYLGLKAGFVASQMTFDGPNKRDEDIQYALKVGVGRFYVDNVGEINRLDKLASRVHRRIEVGFRLRWGFINQRFGMSGQEIEDNFYQGRNLRPIGISVHGGDKLTAMETIGKMGRRLKIEEINLGGGWPVGEGLEKLAGEIKYRLPNSARLAVQPGRAIVGEAGELFTQVVAVKGRWIIVDASTNFLTGLLVKRSFEVVDNLGKEKWYVIAGGTPNGADVLGLAKLAGAKEGIILKIKNAGAYSISRGSRFGMLLPAVYLRKKHGRLVQIRQEDTYENAANSYK